MFRETFVKTTIDNMLFCFIEIFWLGVLANPITLACKRTAGIGQAES
jgi:hypothetical protein